METNSVLPLAQSQNEIQNQDEALKKEVELLLQTFLSNCKELGLSIHPSTYLSLQRDLFHRELEYYQQNRLKKKKSFQKADCPALEKSRKHLMSLYDHQTQS